MEGNSGLKLLTQIDENDVDNTGILMRQAVIDYIKSHTPLKIKSDGHWERDDEHPDEIKWDD
jgi:hypothetical protein